MSDSRRDFLRGAVALGALSACRTHSIVRAPRGGPPPRAARRTPRYDGRPHYVVQVMLLGGFDSILTVDPKDQRVVGDGIDCQYRADQRIQGAERLFGPLIGDLARHDADMCLVHGVRSDTVAHFEGSLACIAGKVSFKGAGSAGAVLGHQLPGGAPMTSLFIGCVEPREGTRIQAVPCCDFFESGFDGGDAVTTSARDVLSGAAIRRRSGVPLDLLGTLIDAPVEDAEARRDQGAAAGARWGAERRHAYVDLLDESTLPSPFDRSPVGLGLGVALDAIRGNVARNITVSAQFLWYDSHTDNYALQQQRMIPTLADLAGFLDQLKTTRNQFGTLLEQTTVMVFSELGRFPKLNHALGKDHFPENSWMLFGKGIRRGATIGETSAKFQGSPIHVGTGRPDPNGRPITLDTMWASVYDIAGADLASHGYKPEQVIHALKA